VKFLSGGVHVALHNTVERQARIITADAGAALPDGLLGILFIVAFLKTPMSSQRDD
jgi:hypothetical protein